MKLTINLDEAKNLHQEYFETNFVITAMKRSGSWDVPPWSFVYGISDLGSWDGNISTDGLNFVVTKSEYLSADKVSKVYKFNRDDIQTIEKGVFKTTFIMNEKIPGLTHRGWLGNVSTFMTLGIFGLLFKSKYFKIRSDNEYDTEKQFNDLLDNPESINSTSDSPENDSKTETKESQPESPEDRLKKLSDVKEKGLIDEDEFKSKKEEILKEI